MIGSRLENTGLWPESLVHIYPWILCKELMDSLVKVIGTVLCSTEAFELFLSFEGAHKTSSQKS